MMLTWGVTQQLLLCSAVNLISQKMILKMQMKMQHDVFMVVLLDIHVT